MNCQVTFMDFKYKSRKLKTKSNKFLEMIDKLITWEKRISIIILFYPSDKCCCQSRKQNSTKNASRKCYPVMYHDEEEYYGDVFWNAHEGV